MGEKESFKFKAHKKRQMNPLFLNYISEEMTMTLTSDKVSGTMSACEPKHFYARVRTINITVDLLRIP